MKKFFNALIFALKGTALCFLCAIVFLVMFAFGEITTIILLSLLGLLSIAAAFTAIKDGKKTLSFGALCFGCFIFSGVIKVLGEMNHSHTLDAVDKLIAIASLIGLGLAIIIGIISSVKKQKEIEIKS